MKRIISISVFLLLVISLVPAGYPCGGKFLGIQDLRGVAPAIRPATILLYKAPKQMPLALKRMGHKVKIIKDAATLLTALKSILPTYYEKMRLQSHYMSLICLDKKILQTEKLLLRHFSLLTYIKLVKFFQTILLCNSVHPVYHHELPVFVNYHYFSLVLS